MIKTIINCIKSRYNFLKIDKLETWTHEDYEQNRKRQKKKNQNENFKTEYIVN